MLPLPLPLLPRSIRYTAVAVVAGIICYGSLVTVPETTIDDIRLTFIQPSHWRHIVAYATLATALAYATDHWELPRRRHAILTIATATVYGVAMEAGQALLPHRSPFLVTDVLVNTLGASLVLVWFLLRPYLDLRAVSTFLPDAG